MIINREDFDLVQKCMHSHKRRAASYRAKRTYLLSGKIVCGTCGSAYVGNARPFRNGQPEYLSYRCNCRTREKRCSGWEIRQGLLESIVLGELANIIFDDAMIPKMKQEYSLYFAEQNQETRTTTKAVKKEINDITKQINNIVSVIAQTASGTLVEKLNELEARKIDLENHLRELGAQSTAQEISEEELARSFKQAREMFKEGKLSTVRVLLERFLKKVTVKGEEIVIEFNLATPTRVVSYSGLHTNSENSKTPHVYAVFWLKQPWLATSGGERGIRTLGRVLAYTRFPVVRLRPAQPSLHITI